MKTFKEIRDEVAKEMELTIEQILKTDMADWNYEVTKQAHERFKAQTEEQLKEGLKPFIPAKDRED